MEGDERKCTITCVPGKIVLVSTFKALFEKTMLQSKLVIDPAVFASRGFRAADGQKTEHVCMSCLQLSGGGCCPDYVRGDRRLKHVIHNMTMVIL